MEQSVTSPEEMEDHPQSLDQQLEEARKTLADYQHLVKSPGWARLLSELIAPQIATRRTAAFCSDWNSMDVLLANAANLNQANGLQLVVSMVEGSIEEAQERITYLLEELRFEEKSNADAE